MYRLILDGGRVLDEEQNIAKSYLKIAGVVKLVDGELRLRNAIYGRVLDRAWVDAHMSGNKLGSAFLSYTRRDNREQEGRLLGLAKLLQSEVARQLSTEFNLFADKDELWSRERWKKSITDSLGEPMFLIPVLTPWYFNRPMGLPPGVRQTVKRLVTVRW